MHAAGNVTSVSHRENHRLLSSADTDDAQVQPVGHPYWWSFALAVAGVCIVPWDSPLADPQNIKFVPGDLKRFFGLSEIFAHGFGVGVIACGIWLLAPQAIRFLPRIIACAITPSLLVHLIKIQFGRQRPICFFDETKVANFPIDQSETWLGWLPYDKLNVVYWTQSFPSAHAATVCGLAIGLAWAFPKGRWLFFAIAILASAQRVLSFAHWPSDVLVGAAIAFMIAGTLTQQRGIGGWFAWMETKIESRRIAGNQSFQ